MMERLNRSGGGTTEAARGSGRWTTLDQLEALANALVARARRDRGAALELAERVRDAVARVTAPLSTGGLLDPMAGAAALARAADRLASRLAPLARETGRTERRPARILQVACGRGQGTLALARALQQRGLPAEVVGTDADDEALAEASRLTFRTATLPVRFASRAQLPPPEDLVDRFDLVVALPDAPPLPGGLARLIASGLPMARRGFHAAVLGHGAGARLEPRPSGRRSRAVGRPGYDPAGLLTSEELALVGALAAPHGRVDVRRSWRGYNVLSVYP